MIVHAYEGMGTGVAWTGFAACSPSRSGTEGARPLFLARDRLGKKPLHYALLPELEQFVFASEMRAMLCHPGIQQKNRSAGGVDSTTGAGLCCPEPGSIYRGIQKLPAAHYLTIERGKAMPKPLRYWTLRFKPTRMSGGRRRA